MPHSIIALVTPSVMKWAREQAGIDITTAAQKIDRPEDDIRGWEDGTKKLTLAQARKAAEVYRRSLAVFYLPEPPQGLQTLRDFRHLPGKQSYYYSPALALLIRVIEYHQSWLRECLILEETEPLDFIGSGTLSTPASDLARAIRNKLNVSLEEQMACKTRRDSLNLWIDKTEDIGINICRKRDIDCTEARGFSLTDSHAPFIYINNADALAAQLFTLAHELAHLWINKPGISNLEDIDQPNNTEEERIEIFCNRVASLMLLDEHTFQTLWSKTTSNNSLEERIKSVSDSTKVSEEVIARRLLERGKISISRYRQLRNTFKERWQRLRYEERSKAKKLHSFPSPHLLKVIGNGRAFTRTVLASYFTGTLSGADASNLLGAKINYFHKIAEHAGLAFNTRQQAPSEQ